jgi:hypothetical protein
MRCSSCRQTLSMLMLEWWENDVEATDVFSLPVPSLWCTFECVVSMISISVGATMLSAQSNKTVNFMYP